MRSQWFRYVLTVFFGIAFGIFANLPAQDTDLDKYLQGAGTAGVNNLIQSLNNGISSSTIQTLHTQKSLNLSLALTNVWVTISEVQQTGPLDNTSGFRFPLAQLELNLPLHLSIIGRGAVLHFGESGKEQPYLWGVGFRYTMLDEMPNSRAGVVLLYQEINRLQDFDMRTLGIQGYFSYLLSGFDLWVAPGVARNLFDIHLFSDTGEGITYRETRFNTFINFSTGFHWHLTHRLSLTSSVLWGEFTAIGIGANLKLF